MALRKVKFVELLPQQRERWFLVETDDTTSPPTVVTWAEITGKPSEFPPTAHGHDASEITGLSGIVPDDWPFALIDAGSPYDPLTASLLGGVVEVLDDGFHGGLPSEALDVGISHIQAEAIA